jgi:hypothetical protein
LCERSGLGELVDVDFEAMSLMQAHRAADVLMRHGKNGVFVVPLADFIRCKSRI